MSDERLPSKTFESQTSLRANWSHQTLRQSHCENLYSRWVSSHTQALEYLLPLSPFTPFELHFAELWSAKQKDVGMRAGIHHDAEGSAVVIEIFGPDDTIPDRIMYLTDDGVRADEFTGDTETYPSLEAALLDIALMY